MVLDQLWIGLWIAMTGIDAKSVTCRARIERRLYAPAPDGFGHRRCQDAHRVEYAAGVVRGIPAIYNALANHNLRTFGAATVHRDDFLGAMSALGVPALPQDAADGCKTTFALCLAMTAAAETRHKAID